MQQKNPKKLFLFKKIAFEQGSTNSHIPEEDTCYWQSICYQSTQRFNMSLRIVYYKPGSLRVIKNIMKVLSCRIYKSLRPFNMLTVTGCSETVFLESGLTKSLRVCILRNKVGITIIFCFKMFKI